MTMPAPVAPPASPFDTMARLVWVQIPRVLGRISPAVGHAAKNRAGWLASVPPLAALIAPAAFVVGGLIGALHWNSPSSYSSSATTVCILLAISCACGAGVGLWITAGYAVGDFLVYGHPYSLADTPVNVLGLRLGLLITYIGLYLLLVQLPATASQVGTAVGTKLQNDVAAKGAHLVAAGVFAFLWASSVPVLLRPMYVWAPLEIGKVPPIGAIDPVQSNGALFAVVAFVFSIGLVVVPDHQEPSPEPEPEPFLAALGPAQGFIRAFVSAILVTMMFAGLAASWLDVAVLYGLIQIAALLRLAVLPLFPGYVRQVNRLPFALRAVLPVVVGMSAGFVLVSLVYADNDLTRTALSFMPVIISLGVGLIAGAFAMPAAPADGGAAT